MNSRGAATECSPGREPGVSFDTISAPGERVFRNLSPSGAAVPERHLPRAGRPGLHSHAAPRLPLHWRLLAATAGPEAGVRSNGLEVFTNKSLVLKNPDYATVAAVYDRRSFLNQRNTGGHRPPLQFGFGP